MLAADLDMLGMMRQAYLEMARESMGSTVVTWWVRGRDWVEVEGDSRLDGRWFDELKIGNALDD